MGELDLREPQFDEVVTVIEPHHDDFWLNVSGTLLKKDKRGELDKIKVLSVFGINPGGSLVTSEIHKRWFSCDFEVKECWLKSLFPNWLRKKGREEMREYVEEGGTIERRFEELNGSWEKFKNMVASFCEGTVLMPQGLCHPDHYLLAGVSGDLFYREYPYWWWGKDKHLKHGQGLFKAYSYGIAGKTDLGIDIWLAKWRIFATTYQDVLATFHPRFSKPYYRNVRDEIFWVKVE